jgi:hypothetical protein
MKGFDPPSAHQTGGDHARHRRGQDGAGSTSTALRIGASIRPCLKQYRRALWDGGRDAQIPGPLRNNVELSATFISPTSPDLDNLLTALFQALDGKCGQGPMLLADDRQIVFVKNLGLMFP